LESCAKQVIPNPVQIKILKMSEPAACFIRMLDENTDTQTPYGLHFSPGLLMMLKTRDYRTRHCPADSSALICYSFAVYEADSWGRWCYSIHYVSLMQ
jgi:hypothetical protein